MKSREIWIFLFFASLLALGWPFLEIFGGSLPQYLFTAWFFIIVVIYIAVKTAAKGEGKGL